MYVCILHPSLDSCPSPNLLHSHPFLSLVLNPPRFFFLLSSLSVCMCVFFDLSLPFRPSNSIQSSSHQSISHPLILLLVSTSESHPKDQSRTRSVSHEEASFGGGGGSRDSHETVDGILLIISSPLRSSIPPIDGSPWVRRAWRVRRQDEP